MLLMIHFISSSCRRMGCTASEIVVCVCVCFFLCFCVCICVCVILFLPSICFSHRLNLNVLRYESLASLQTQNVSYDPRDYYSSPSLSATCSCALDDLASLFEDERYFLDI